VEIYGYDGVGNLRLTNATLPGSGGTVSFKYDPLGRRIYKSSSAGTSIYAYDWVNLIEEANASGVPVARYSQGLKVDEPLAMLRTGTTSFNETDGLGSITSLSSTAGAVVANYTYDSFGNVVATSGNIVNHFQYTGREWDAETSLYYYRARYYDPAAGRFLAEDPIRFKAGTNFYKYVSNNPILLGDPTGLCGSPSPQQKCSELQTIVGVTGALAAANALGAAATAELPPVSAVFGAIAAAEGIASGVFAIVWLAFCY